MLHIDSEVLKLLVALPYLFPTTPLDNLDINLNSSSITFRERQVAVVELLFDLTDLQPSLFFAEYLEIFL